MLVFAKEKLVLFSVPKTGTTAVEAALASRASLAIVHPPELKHAPVYRYNRFIRPMVEKFIGDDVETVAVIRDPVSWLGSWYRYRARPFLDGKRTSTKGISFADFVTDYLNDPRPPHANVGSQAKFVEPRPNGTSITRFFRYEEFDAYTAFLEERFGHKLEISRLNTSPDIDLTLPPELEQKLRQDCAADFALWDACGLR